MFTPPLIKFVTGLKTITNIRHLALMDGAGGRNGVQHEMPMRDLVDWGINQESLSTQKPHSVALIEGVWRVRGQGGEWEKRGSWIKKRTQRGSCLAAEQGRRYRAPRGLWEVSSPLVSSREFSRAYIRRCVCAADRQTRDARYRLAVRMRCTPCYDHHLYPPTLHPPTMCSTPLARIPLLKWLIKRKSAPIVFKGSFTFSGNCDLRASFLSEIVTFG